MFGVQGVSYLAPLITLPYLVKTLGPESYGVLGFSLAFVQYFCMLTDYGFNLSATHEIAVSQGDKDTVSRIFWSVLLTKAVLAVVSFTVLVILSLISPYISSQKNVIYSAFGLVIANVVFPMWLFQGKEKMGMSSISNICSRLLAIPLTFIFVSTPDDVWVAAFVMSVTAIMGGVFSLFIVYKEKWIYLRPVSMVMISSQLKSGWHLFISSAAINLYTSSVTVILGLLCGPVSVGYFVAADKIRLAIQNVIGPVSQALYPKLSTLIINDMAQGMHLLRKVFKWFVVSTLIISGTMYMMSDRIIGVIYGHQYTSSQSVLKILSACPFLVGLGNVFCILTLLAIGYRREVSKIYVVIGVLSVFFLVPLSYLYQENGAALSVVITELLVSFSMAVCIKKKNIPLFSNIIR